MKLLKGSIYEDSENKFKNRIIQNSSVTSIDTKKDPQRRNLLSRKQVSRPLLERVKKTILNYELEIPNVPVVKYKNKNSLNKKLRNSKSLRN